MTFRTMWFSFQISCWKNSMKMEQRANIFITILALIILWFVYSSSNTESLMFMIHYHSRQLANLNSENTSAKSSYPLYKLIEGTSFFWYSMLSKATFKKERKKKRKEFSKVKTVEFYTYSNYISLERHPKGNFIFFDNFHKNISSILDNAVKTHD